MSVPDKIYLTFATPFEGMVAIALSSSEPFPGSVEFVRSDNATDKRRERDARAILRKISAKSRWELSEALAAMAKMEEGE